MTSAFVKRILILFVIFLITLFLMVGYGAVKTNDCSKDPFLQKYDCSLIKIKTAAQKGNPSAEYALGYIYFYGISTPRDLKAAKLWILRAATKGHPLAIRAKRLLRYGSYSKVPSKPLGQFLPRYEKSGSPRPVSRTRSTPMPVINRVRD